MIIMVIKMKIKDELYGEHEFPDYFQKIIDSNTIQRLKGIHQGGADFLRDSRMTTTRYDHSIGVMILTKIFGGSEEAQLSALLHDISHTVFSHTIDIVEDNDDQDYHEIIKHEFLKNSNLLELLAELNVDLDYVLNEENFSIVEQSAPDICTDRLDYFLRDMNKVELLSKDEINEILSGLIVEDEKIICKNLDIAEFIATKFLQLNTDLFFNPNFEVINIQLSDFIRRMLEKDIISRDDFMGVDCDIIEKIKNSEFSKEFDNIIHTPVVVVEKGDYYRKRKLRYIDPLVVSTGRRVSEDSELFRSALEKYKKTPTVVYYDI